MTALNVIADQNRSVFPPLETWTCFEHWLQLCDTIKDTNTRFEALDGEALAKLVNHSGPEGQLESAWLATVKATLKTTCEPADRDANRKIRKDLDSLPEKADALFGGNISKLLQYFRVKRALALKYHVQYTDATLADILIRSIPEVQQITLRMMLKDDQYKSTRVLEELGALLQGTGALLGAETKGVTVKEEEEAACFVGAAHRPRTQFAARTAPRAPGTQQHWRSPQQKGMSGEFCFRCGRAGGHRQGESFPENAC
eukprot:GHVU01128903.1.p1 GENE.GHVU01128903.1~~GHVU01128903.1.p1  ORF type:complete len:282 (+),score=20.61 GHVU01128903.1:78-848(+)